MLTYNREQYVTRAIQSILSQDFKDFEFIIINNGSTDQSKKICQKFANQDERIRYIEKPRGNIGSGRNAGLQIAKGQYITFIDDDDYAYKDMLSFLLRLAKKHQADIAVCGSTKEIEEKNYPNCIFEELLIMNAEEAVVELLKRVRINSANPTKLFHRKLFQKIAYEETGKYDDISVIYKLFAESKKTVAHGLPKYCFFRHQGNNSNFTTNDSLITPNQLDEYFNAFKERTIYLSKKLPAITEYAQYSEWSYMISMCNKIISSQLTSCKKQLQYIKECLQNNYDKFYNSEYILPFEKKYMEKYITKPLF